MQPGPVVSRVIRLLPIGLVWAAVAAAQAAPKTRSFSVDLGFVNASGNTSVTAFNLGEKFLAHRSDTSLIFTQTFSAVRASTSGEKTAENYKAQLRLDRKLSGRVYLFGLVGWDRNVFGGVDRRFEETIGVAYQAVRRPKDELALEVGLSMFQQRNTLAAAGQSRDDNFSAARIAGLYKHTFKEAAFVSQLLELIPNLETGDDFRLNSETAFIAPLSTNVGLKVGYVIRYDNLPGLAPAPNPNNALLKKTDRFLTVGITISY